MRGTVAKALRLHARDLIREGTGDDYDPTNPHDRHLYRQLKRMYYGKPPTPMIQPGNKPEEKEDVDAEAEATVNV